MMNQLKEKLHCEQCSLVILHEGKMITFSGHGVRTLYNILSEQPEVLFESKLAVKAVGRTAAKNLITGKVDEVYADFISEPAYNALKDADIKVMYGKKVSHSEFLKIWERLGEHID